MHSKQLGWREAFTKYLPRRCLRPQPVYSKPTSKNDGLSPPSFVDPTTGEVKRTAAYEANRQHRMSQQGAQAGTTEGEEPLPEEIEQPVPLSLSDFGVEDEEDMGEEEDGEGKIPLQEEIFDPEAGEFISYRGPFSHVVSDPYLMRDEARRQRVRVRG